jgi:hypothetical protein
MHGFFMIFFGVRRSSVTYTKKLSFEDDAKQSIESVLKDIVINRNASGKEITTARKELERRGITLTETEKLLQEAKRQERIEYAKRNSMKKSKSNWLTRLFN